MARQSDNAAAGDSHWFTDNAPAKMRVGARVALICYAIVSLGQAMGVASAQTNAFTPTFEQNTARDGQTYHVFKPSLPLATLCQTVCMADAQCRAWEYGPGQAGQSQSDQTCQLKDKAPPPTRSPGHVAGVVRPDGSVERSPQAGRILQMAISSADNLARCVDIPHGRFEQNARLQIWDCNNGAAQLFSYDLTGQHLMIGKLCVQAEGIGQQGAAVTLGTCSKQPSLTWKLAWIDANQKHHVQFVGINNLCMDIAGGSANKGALLQVSSCTGAPAQQWGFRGMSGL